MRRSPTRTSACQLSPTTASSQPIGFRGRRAASSDPTPTNANIVQRRIMGSPASPADNSTCDTAVASQVPTIAAATPTPRRAHANRATSLAGQPTPCAYRSWARMDSVTRPLWPIAVTPPLRVDDTRLDRSGQVIPRAAQA